MIFENRNTEFPGRVKIVKQDGTSEVCTIVPNEGATTGTGYCEGTPLNKATLTQMQNDVVTTAKAYTDQTVNNLSVANKAYTDQVVESLSVANKLYADQAVNNLLNAMCITLTAEEYDNKQLTAQSYDNKRLSALHYDIYSKIIF